MRSNKMHRRQLAFGKLPEKLHFGCGSRMVSGWLNCDLVDSDIDIDLGCGKLPFSDSTFSAICSQHVIEHLHIADELEPLMSELFRCSKAGAEVWLSCPDIEKICCSYVNNKGADMVADRQSRFPHFTTRGYPVSMMINYLFHQNGQHKNLFDFDLLEVLLKKSGFQSVEVKDEGSFLARFPEFPERRDDFQSLYVKAVKP